METTGWTKKFLNSILEKRSNNRVREVVITHVRKGCTRFIVGQKEFLGAYSWLSKI